MRKYTMEFIGTFFLVLTVGCSVIGGGAGMLAPLAIGSALMVMIFAGGHVSGAHYNPAVTLGVWIRGRCDTKDVAPYIVAQAVGALVAAVVVGYLKAGVRITPKAVSLGPASVAEFLFTFALAFVVINVATAKGTAGNSFYGLAIGMTVMTGIFAVGDISGGVLNPAVGLGVGLMGLGSWSTLGIYMLVELAGGAAAGFMFKALNPSDT